VLSDVGCHGISHALPELLVAPGPPGTAQDGKFTGQTPLPEQLEQGWDQLAMSEIAASPKDHQALRADHPFLP
jgi:hypothetical protein